MRSFLLFSLSGVFLSTTLFGHIEDSQIQSMDTSAPIRSEYTPSVGPLPCHNIDIVIDLEFLYWYSSITNLSYATKYQTIDRGNEVVEGAVTVVPMEIKNYDWNWNPGLRLGLGAVTNYEGWDVYTDWTYYSSNTKAAHAVSPLLHPDALDRDNVGLSSFGSSWLLFGVGNGGTALTEVRSNWKLVFNQIDLELGRNFWVSDNLSLRPYGGLRGHWARITFDLQGILNVNTDTPNLTNFFDETDRFKQKFWGIGLLSGIESTWFMTKKFAIFADIDVALLSGEFKTRRHWSQFQRQTDGDVIENVYGNYRHNKGELIQPILDLALGLRYEFSPKSQSFKCLFDAGWEQHFYFDYNNLDHINSNSSDDERQQNYLPADGNLSLMGLVIRGRIEF